MWEIVKDGQYSLIREIVTKNPEIIHRRNRFGSTLLHAAAYYGNIEIAKFLVASGADIFAKDKNGYTPLLVAGGMKKKNLVQYLLNLELNYSINKNSQKIISGISGKKYDFFISYKSQNVYIARQIVDQLISSGYNIWFAEYRILLKDRGQFQTVIDEGLANSEQAILFTNKIYAESPYCSDEAEKLLQNYGQDKIIEIKIPAEPEVHQKFPALAGCKSVETFDVNEMINFLKKTVAPAVCTIEIIPSKPEFKFEGVCKGAPFTLYASGWKITQKGTSYLGDIGNGLEIRYKKVKQKFYMNIHFSIDESELAKFKSMDIVSADDRKLYDALLEYSKKHVSRLDAEVLGAHLVFHGGASQLALTYWMGYWTRKYSITLIHPTLKKPVEFLFTFGFQGTFQEYCRYVHIMDSVIKSLEWK